MGCYLWLSRYEVLGFLMKKLGYRDTSIRKGYAYKVSIYGCRGSSLSYRFMSCCLISRLTVISLGWVGLGIG